MTRLAPFAALFVAGCSLGLDPLSADPGSDGSTGDGGASVDGGADAGGDDGGGSGGDGGSSDLIDVSSVSPWYGTNAGGQEVLIGGGPFDDSAVVRFGGSAAHILETTATQLTVETPTYSSEGYVDVTVSTDAGSGSLTSAFLFFEDGTSKAGVLGYHEWIHYVGNYWGSPSPTDFGESFLFFTVPTDAHWWDLLAPDGGCAASDWDSGLEIYVVDHGVSTVTVVPQSGNNTTLTWDEAHLGYANDDLANNQFTQNASYDLLEVTGDHAPPFGVEDLLKTPSSFTVSKPAIEGSSAPDISRTQTLTWSSGGADKVVIMMGLVNAAGTEYEQFIYCVTDDTGSFTVPSSAWTSWATGRQVNVFVGKAREGAGTIDWNNAESRVAGMYFLLGAGYSR